MGIKGAPLSKGQLRILTIEAILAKIGTAYLLSIKLEDSDIGILFI